MPMKMRPRRTRRTYKKRTTPFKKVNTRALVTRTKTSRLIRLIKNVALKQAERCYKTVSRTVVSINHNTARRCDAWSDSDYSMFPAQGVSDSNRIGDEIYCSGIMYRGVYQIPQDRRNTRFKLYWVQFNSIQGDPGDRTQLQHSVTGNIMCDPIQQDRWPGIRYLGTFQCRAVDQTTGSQDKTIVVKRWIPLKRKVHFRDDGTTIVSKGVKEFGTLIICPYDTIPTLTTDTIIVTSQHAFTLYYKSP